MRRPIGALVAAMMALIPAQRAAATWSIILMDVRTGEVAVGSATCLTNFDLRAGTPVLIPGIGAATAQSFVDTTGQNRVLIRDRLAQGLPPQEILSQLATFDSGHQTRQYGIVDRLGRAATFSGTGAGAWAGGVTGQFSYVHEGRQETIAYAIQGNVLTGAPVVEQARLAVINTKGDLAARMMAGMQAARAMGGDGRCSCNQGPTGCGSPPASFTKSAHIAYMLIARAGDREGSNGIHRTAPGPVHVSIADVTSDGRPDLVLASNSSSSVSVVPNTTPSSPPFPTFGPLPATHPTSGGPRGLAVADVSGDGISDVLAADSVTGSVTVLLGLAGGGFAPGVSYPTGAFCRAVAVADLDGVNGPEFISANATASTVTIGLNDGSGGFAGIQSLTVAGGPTDLIAGQLVGSPAVDVAVLCRTSNRLVILEGDGSGGLLQHPGIPTGAAPNSLAAADLDNDGDTDLAVSCETAQALQVFINNAGAFVGAPYTIGFVPQDVAAGDTNGDGFADLIGAGGNRFATLLNNGQGQFLLSRTYTLLGSVSSAALGDLDDDGDLDLALANGGVGGAMVARNYGPGPLLGTFTDGIGCATGDYFMNFNIAFQTFTAPDPVVQLQSQYDAWRASLIGVPDAVLSETTLSPPYLPADGTSQSTLTIRLRDWQGVGVTGPAQISVSLDPASTGGSAVGPVVQVSPGIYSAVITAGLSPGIDSFIVRILGGPRPVTLMPQARLALHSAGCYADCDHSGAPTPLTIADFTCFLQRYAAGDPYANCDQSSAPPPLNVADFTCYLSAFAAGCK